MKHSLEIYKKDLITIFTNYAVLITVIALCILPSLYAWINIKASWDPYSSEATSRIKVAVVNNDKGIVLSGQQINIGQDVVSGLKENKLLGWQFLNEKEAMTDLEDGKVYATIIIPEEFSSDLTSVMTHSIKKAEIKYIVNEKMNAIAPKITIKGAEGIQSTVEEQLIETISNTILTKAKELGIELEDVYLPKLSEVENVLRNIESKFTDVNQFLNQAEQDVEDFDSFLNEVIDYIPRFKELIEGTQELVTEIDTFTNTAEAGLNTLAPTIKKDIGLINDISSEVYTDLESLDQFIQAESEKAPETVDNLLTKVEGLEQLTNAASKILNSLDQLLNNNSLDDVMSQIGSVQSAIETIKSSLTTLKDKVENGDFSNLTVLDDTKSLLGDIRDISSGLYENFDTEIVEEINSIFNQVNNVMTDSSQVLTDIKGTLPEVVNLMEEAQDIMQTGKSGLEQIKEVMPQLEDKVTLLTNKISEVNQSKSLRAILDLLKEDVKERSDFLSNSTNVVEETIFPMGNYGSQMAPFYSSLASWVGLTILVSIISVEVEGEYKSYEVYFGKLLTYMTIALLQGFIIGLGDLYILKIYCSNPALFIIGMLFISLTFTFIVYSLVSVFGNLGKVVAIILMIIQVAGSGGTFPVQLTSNFFINVNPYLPFTYAISFLREAIGGAVRNVLVRDITVLGGIMVGVVIISVLLKKYMNKLLAGFTEKFHEGGL